MNESPHGADPYQLSAMVASMRKWILDVTPALTFTLAYATTRQVGLAVTLAMIVGVVVLSIRLVQRRSPWLPIGALMMVSVGAATAGLSGSAEAFFLPKIILQCVTATAGAVLLVAGYPIVGVMLGLVRREGLAWRRCPPTLRACRAASAALLASSLLVLSVNIPLYLAHNAVALGIVDVLHPVVRAITALIAWRLYAARLRGHRCAPACRAGATQAA